MDNIFASEIRRLRSVLDDIAHSLTDNADLLRNKAAYAIFRHSPDTLAEAIGVVDEFLEEHEITQEVATTAKRILADNKDIGLPSILPHGDKKKLSLTWGADSIAPDRKTMMIVGDGSIEPFSIYNGEVTMHQAYHSYSGGKLPETFTRHIKHPV